MNIKLRNYINKYIYSYISLNGVSCNIEMRIESFSVSSRVVIAQVTFTFGYFRAASGNVVGIDLFLVHVVSQFRGL